MFFSHDGVRIRKSCGTSSKKLAEEIYCKLKTELREGKWFNKPIGENKTFGEMMAKFDREYFSHMESSKFCRSYFNGLVDYFGKYRLSQISPRLIYQFKGLRKAKGIKPATINRQLTIAKRAYNIAVREWEWCSENPFSKIPSEKGATKRNRWLTCEEERKLLANCPGWLKDLVVFATWTGIRVGNIISLRRSQVNLSRAEVYLGENGAQRTKNNEPLVIPLSQKALDVLKRKLEEGCDPVFRSPMGMQIDPNNLRRAFNKAVKNTGIEDFRIHDLRHTYGTRLAQAGVDLYTIAKLLGHKDIRATQRYAHHCTESLKRGISILETQTDTILTQSPNLCVIQGGRQRVSN